MFLLNTTMLRERFTVTEAGNPEPMVALGNRIALPLVSKNGLEERYVVRGHNMHTTLRMAGMICGTFFHDGPILTRKSLYEWEKNWAAVVPGYEIENNPNSWIAVYNAGQCIYSQGEYHPFLDVIEQCDARNRDEYDRAVQIAESAFNLAGRGVSIDHQSTIAMVVGAMKEKTRIGLIFRTPRRSGTFNFNAETGKKESAQKMVPPSPSQCLFHAAAWLELIQLSVQAGFFKAKKGTIYSETVKHDDIQRRLGRVNSELKQFEEAFTVVYRPERPDLMQIIEETEQFARGDFAKKEYRDLTKPSQE